MGISFADDVWTAICFFTQWTMYKKTIFNRWRVATQVDWNTGRVVGHPWEDSADWHCWLQPNERLIAQCVNVFIFFSLACKKVEQRRVSTTVLFGIKHWFFNSRHNTELFNRCWLRNLPWPPSHFWLADNSRLYQQCFARTRCRGSRKRPSSPAVQNWLHELVLWEQCSDVIK